MSVRHMVYTGLFGMKLYCMQGRDASEVPLPSALSQEQEKKRQSFSGGCFPRARAAFHGLDPGQKLKHPCCGQLTQCGRVSIEIQYHFPPAP